MRQTQVDTFTVDSSGRLFRVPLAFRMPVTIRVRFPGGERLQQTDIQAREQVVTIDSIAADPTMVVFDDGNRILKSLVFDQPVAWLAEELRRDDNLWDRRWAIAELARHPGDPVAVAALVEAATRADYYLTRVEAVEALGDLPASTAMAALSAAARDTSAAVRTAAVAAMARSGGAAAAAVARDLFQHDSSYAVRAAALQTLVQADPAHAHDLLARALATASYRDVIAGAALQGILQTNDTTLVDRVDAAIAQQEFPAHVLAALGARGNAHALDLITGHLNDRRAGVRRWTVNAFSNTMARVNKGVTLQRLRSVVAGIRDPATRQQVTDLIARLDKP